LGVYMKFLIFITTAFFASFALASESYQMKNAPGLWKTLDAPFLYRDLLVTTSADGNTLELSNCTIDVEMTGTCDNPDGYTGRGIFIGQTDNIQVTETSGSPTPSYTIKLDANNPKRLLRSWGDQTIKYLRVK
jgi:hypothetical protein